jgi:RNA-directed DNA polymerase
VSGKPEGITAKLKIRQKLRERLHEKTKDMGKWLGSVVRGYFRCHAVPRNEERLNAFRHEVLHMWLWQLRRRSQRNRRSWERFQGRLGHLIPEVEIQHPYPKVRFASQHPR